MYKYTYCLDGINHKIVSQEPIPNINNVIPISKEQNQIAKELKELLREWVRIAKNHNIDWFCNGGTLLGAIRDKGFIHYDNDVDLCVFFKDYNKIKNAICSDKFYIDVCEQGFQLKYKSKQFPFIDLFLHAPNPENPNEIILACPYLNNRLTYYASKVCPNDKYDINDVSQFKKIPFEGIMVNVPQNYKKYVKRMYGNDCLTRYVIYEHTDKHMEHNNAPNSKYRMLLWNTLDKMDPILFRSVASLIVNYYVLSDHQKIPLCNIISRDINERIKLSSTIV